MTLRASPYMVTNYLFVLKTTEKNQLTVITGVLEDLLVRVESLGNKGGWFSGNTAFSTVKTLEGCEALLVLLLLVLNKGLVGELLLLLFNNKVFREILFFRVGDSFRLLL